MGNFFFLIRFFVLFILQNIGGFVLLGVGYRLLWKYVVMNVFGVLWYMVCMFVNFLFVYFYQGIVQKVDGKEGEKLLENVVIVKIKEKNVE